MKKTYSVGFKKKMVTRLIGQHAPSAMRLSAETGVSQEALSRWLRDASNLPVMASNKRGPSFTVDRKAEIVVAASKLEGQELLTYLEREGVKFAELELWRFSLAEDGAGSHAATSKHIRRLERDLARKEKALAEAAALLLLKKKLEDYYSEGEDDDTKQKNDK